MSVFLQRFLKNKKYILILFTVLYTMGFFYGLYQYHHSSQSIKDFFQHLFYLNIEGYENHYHLFLLQSGIYILICTYLSSSYLGIFGLLFLGFVKGLYISYSLTYVFLNIKWSFIIIVMIILELIIEILLCIIMNTGYIYLSIYVLYVTFFVEQNFNMKSILNYKLNIIIISLMLLSLSLMLRIYIVPLF